MVRVCVANAAVFRAYQSHFFRFTVYTSAWSVSDRARACPLLLSLPMFVSVY